MACFRLLISGSVQKVKAIAGKKVQRTFLCLFLVPFPLFVSLAPTTISKNQIQQLFTKSFEREAMHQI